MIFWLRSYVSAYFSMWFSMIINEFLIWFLWGSFSHGNVCVERKKERKKINRLAIRLIWCYSPIICINILSSSATKLIKNSERLVTDLLASSDYSLSLAKLYRSASVEKINIRRFNNSLITSRQCSYTNISPLYTTTRYYQSVYSEQARGLFPHFKFKFELFFLTCQQLFFFISLMHLLC